MIWDIALFVLALALVFLTVALAWPGDDDEPVDDESDPAR
jgi:hypothetical protein